MGVEIKVGMADLNVCVSPDRICTLGLGSCVGIALRDPVTKIGGLAHIMLPDSTTIRNNSNIPKFADTGIEELVKQVTRKGANRSRLVAKIAGGAQMFGFNSNSEMVTRGREKMCRRPKRSWRSCVFRFWRRIPARISGERLFFILRPGILSSGR